MVKVHRSYETKQLTVYYLLDDHDRCGIILRPKDMPLTDLDNLVLDPLVHIFAAGDITNTGFASGVSMRHSTTTQRLRFADQSFDPESGTVETVLRDDTGLKVTHICKLLDAAVCCKTVVCNEHTSPIILEMVTSFSVNAAARPIDNEKTMIHRLRSTWSSENRMLSQSLASLNLEESWSGHGFRTERFGSIGSLPVRQYYPFAALEFEDGYTVAATLDAPYSWQLEISRKAANELCLSGGVADYEFGHYRKTLEAGAVYETQYAYITAVCGGPDDALRVFNRIYNEQIRYLPESEKTLPVIYNEFCYTWGNPRADLIEKLTAKIKDWGIDYFVIDAGWYQNDNGYWENNMGDWNVSAKLFPEGIKKVADQIRSCGMIPGIWFELETIGYEADAAQIRRQMLLKRNGRTIQSGRRLFWNFSDPQVPTYLDEKILAFLKDNGFDYLKVDYNESVGIGCDHPDSLGAGLEENVKRAQAYYHRLHQHIPELVLEICASGGHRNEPSFLGLSSMNSFSDAHECSSIPVIAANVGMTVPARQNQIWCVVRPDDSSQRLIYSLAATFVGRMCLSGDLCALQPWQDLLIREGIAFYKAIRPVIMEGDQYIYRKMGASYNDPVGSQIVVRKNERYCLVIAHSFASPVKMQIPLPEGYTVVRRFGEDLLQIEKHTLTFQPDGDFCAAAILLERK